MNGISRKSKIDYQIFFFFSVFFRSTNAGAPFSRRRPSAFWRRPGGRSWTHGGRAGRRRDTGMRGACSLRLANGGRQGRQGRSRDGGRRWTADVNMASECGASIAPAGLFDPCRPEGLSRSDGTGASFTPRPRGGDFREP